MDERKIALKLVMDRLELDNSTFERRLILQKTLFLLQEKFNLDFGYRYNWYLRGPYSPELTKDAFDIQGSERYYSELAETTHLSSDAKRRMARFRSKLGTHLESAKMMELLASLTFVSDRWGAQQAITKLAELKPGFKKKEIQEAASILRGS